MRQLTPMLETFAYASELFASESVVRTWSIRFPWLDRPDFLSFRAAHVNRSRLNLARTTPKQFLHLHNNC